MSRFISAHKVEFMITRKGVSRNHKILADFKAPDFRKGRKQTYKERSSRRRPACKSRDVCGRNPPSGPESKVRCRELLNRTINR